jgi:hypothetical protein
LRTSDNIVKRRFGQENISAVGMHQALRAGLRFYPLFACALPAFRLRFTDCFYPPSSARFPKRLPQAFTRFARILAAAADFC